MKDFALKTIYAAIDELNQDLDKSERLEKSPSSVIFGPDSILDSMSLVNLITIIEERIEDEKGVYLTLADEKAMSMKTSPFRTVDTLTDYIIQRLSE